MITNGQGTDYTAGVPDLSPDSYVMYILPNRHMFMHHTVIYFFYLRSLSLSF